jgi:aspartokinase-like uncharacterized kinase
MNPIRVVKVGGSLLQAESLALRLAAWLATQKDAQSVLIAGGGKVADAVREIDALHGIGPAASHWLCVQLLDVTSQILSLLVPAARRICCVDELRDELAAGTGDLWILSAEKFLRGPAPRLAGAPLPSDWRTTTDSIAAQVAVYLGARELVLLKSCDLPSGVDRRQAALLGLVDEVFPEASRSLPVRWVNFRDSQFAESVLMDESHDTNPR